MVLIQGVIAFFIQKNMNLSRTFLTLLGTVFWSMMLVVASIAHAETEEDGRYWLSLYAQGALPMTNTFWSMDLHPRWREEGQQFDQLIIRPAVFYRFNPKTSVWLGYDTVINHPSGQSAFRENRLWQQFQYQFDAIEDITLVSRTRFEQRHREGSDDTGHRLRQMLRATTPSRLHANLYWLVFDEVFINMNDTEWGVRRGMDQNRLFLGIHWKFDQRMNMDVGYLNQWVNGRTLDRENHVLSTTFRFNF